MYSVFHQSGTRGEVRVVDIVVVHGAVGIDVVRVIGIGVRGAQAPVDGANRPYPNERQPVGSGAYLCSCPYRPASVFMAAARALSLSYHAAHI